ncbi:UNVERIFIED_CONTAM: hypothetical protein FKN15_038231 [Acipenser sinensis]
MAAADPWEVTVGGEPAASKAAAGAPLLPLLMEAEAACSLPLVVEEGVASSPPRVAKECEGVTKTARVGCARPEKEYTETVMVMS